MKGIGYQLGELIRFLKAAEIKYAVLGGIALSLYSEPRMTEDIDLNIILEQKDVAVFVKKARAFGFRPLPPNIDRFAKETGVLPMSFLKNGVRGKFDFIIAQNPIEVKGLRRARLRTLCGVKAKVVTAEDLLLHKFLSDRPRDREDARGIILRQGRKLDMVYVRSWLKKIDRVSAARSLAKEFKLLLKECGKHV